ncbi:MAG: alcohol dehydrogenase catalytic domain-containing protein [Rhizobiales bacterium]|nr:alcohol dehydrogenase catalytic domain-containing protein [Hyphomicrobiales bacterium]
MATALFIHGAHDARIDSYQPSRTPGADVLIDVAAVGLCGSDLHYYKDGGIGSAVIREPFVPGHEFGGFLSRDLPHLSLKAGQLVALDPNESCGKCEYCLRGHTNLCPRVEFIGAPPFQGAMAEQIWVRASQVMKIPSHFTPLQAAMLEPLGVAIHVVDLAKPKPGERIAVLGCGPIGLLVMKVLRASGKYEIIAADPLEHRRAMALRDGAGLAVESGQQVQDVTDREGCPLVIEATNSPDGFRDAVLASKIGGRIVLAGIPDGNIYTLPAAEARRRGLKIKFARRMGEVYPRAIDMVDRGLVDVAAIVTNEIGLDAGPDAFRDHAANAPGLVKTIIYPNGKI